MHVYVPYIVYVPHINKGHVVPGSCTKKVGAGKLGAGYTRWEDIARNGTEK